MKLKSFVLVVLAACSLSPAITLAANTVLSDIFDGSENRTDPLPGSCGGTDLRAYKDVGTFQVSANGDYLVTDAYNYNGVDVTALIYSGAFDPQNPQNNLLTPLGIDYADYVSLSAGVPYRLVVQQWCQNIEGAWAVAFSGPGNVTSPVVRAVPDMTQGQIVNADPLAAPLCENFALTDGRYREFGPIQVQADGTYYYTDILWVSGVDVDICLQVYSAPFNPSSPNSNRIGAPMDDDGTVELEAGEDYYFVTQALVFEGQESVQTGQYFFVLAPPAPFRISKALAGAWYNPQTNGQGMFIDVYDNTNQLFVGWYTFDLNRPVDGTAQLGEPGHRWLTALGPISGNQASLDVYLARGGAFDSVSPPIDNPQTVVGSMDIEFTDCMTGTVDYTLTMPQVSGQIPVQPLAGEHVELCQSMVDVPGMPGPL